ncbi:MAG: phosphotransferase, partial [Candidatus Omnitrophica bacterium]|nr:phosphotransferase [Candidatus Omnitrophota bacterium]
MKFEVFLSLTERKLDDDKAAQYVSERRRRGRDVLILNPETMQFEIKPADEIPGYVVYRLKDGERIDGYLRFRYVLVPSPLGMRAMISKEKAKDILQDALNKPELLAGRTFTQENIDAVQRLISAGADFNVISDSNGNGIQISQVGSTSIPTTLLDFLRSSAYFNSKVFPKIKAVAVDMDGTLIGGTPDSEGEAIDALIRLLDVVERVYIVSSNEFKNVENKIIHRVPVGKRHKISVFSARGTILTEFDEYGNALPKTTTLGEKHIQNSFLTETHLQEIRSAVNSVASEFNQDVRDGGPETDRTWKERYPGFYNGFYINSTGKHDEHRARINKTDRNGKIVSIRRVIQVEEHRYADMVITQFPSKKYALNRTDDERPEFIRRVKEKLSADILSLIDIVPESSVGIGIKRKGVGKSIAMQEILKSFKSDEVIYFGDEFWEGGMDREIAEEFPITAVAVDEDQSRIHSKAWGSIAGATNLDATAQWFTALLENKVKMNIQGLKEENYFLSVFIDPDLMSAATKIIPMIKKHAYEFEKERGRPLNRKELSDFVQWDEEILARASNRKIQQIPDLLIISGINIDTSSKNGISAAKEIFNQMMTVPFEEVGDVIRELRDPKKRREAIIALKWMANVAELSEDGYLSERNRAREVLEKFLEIFFSDFNGKKILDAFAQMAEEKISEKIDQGVNPEEILVVPVLTSGEQIGQYVASRVKRTKNVVSQPLLFTTAMTYAFGRMENEEIPRQGKVFTEVGKRNALRYLEQEGILKKNLKHIIFIDTGMTGSFGKLFDSVFEGTGISTELLLIDHADYEKAKVEKIWAHGLNDEEAWSDREKELRWMTIIFDQFIEHSEESPSHLMEGVSDGGFIRVARRPTNHPWFAGFVKQEFDRMAKQDAGVYISTRGGGDNALLTEERLEQAKEILRLFGIDKIESARDLEGNVVNENNPVLVRLDTEKVVLRKFQYTKSQIRFIVSVMNKLKAEGIPVPRLYRRAETKSSGADSYIAEYRGEYYILEEFIDAGEHVPLKDVTNDHFRAIARLAAKINNVLAGFQPEGAKQYTSRRAIAKNIRTSFIEFKEYVEAMSVTNRQEAHSLFLEHFDLLIEQLDVFDAGYNPRAQKTSVVHGDMHPVNTKFDKNGRIVGLVDFDFTITDHRVVEFNNLVMGKNVTDRPYSRTKLLAIVSAYNSAVNEKLDDEEIRAVIQIIRLRFLEGMKNRYVKENGFVDPERFKASIEALNQFNNDFATDDQINAFIQEVERATTKMSTERGRLKNLQAVDWLINRVENIQGILISARVRKKFEVLLYDHYVNEITPHVDAYGDGLYEQEKRQLYLLAREAGIFHNGTFDEAGFSLDVQINGELEQQMFRARTEFYERMEELKQLSRHYWEAELPKYKGEVFRYNEDKRDKKPTVSVGIASLFGKRTDSLLKRLDELNSMAGKKEMELVITIADPENFKDDKRRALEAKIQTVGFPVTIVLTKKNTICTNRNLAASLSTGDYQIFVDDDVSLVGDVITTLVEALERRPEFGILSIASYSRRKELYKPRFVLKSFVDDTVLVSNLVLGMVTATRRDIIEVNPFLPLLANLGDDIHFVRQIHMLGFLGGYVLDTEVYAVDEQVGGSATKGQISIHPYLIEEGLSYFLNAHDYSEYEHRRAGFKIHTFSKENVSPQMAIRFWRRFSAAVLSFLQGDGNTFEFDMRTFNFPESIKVQVEAAIEYFQDQKDRIVKYKADEYDPKNLSHVNTFFGMLQYSAEIAQEDVSYVRPLESTAAERGKDDTTMLMEKERKAVARDLVELY